MPRPQTKQDLIATGDKKYKELWNLINSMSDVEQNATFNFDFESLGKEAHWKRDKNLRDVLIHLYEWHQLLLNWVESNQNGIKKQFLLEPYNWRTYGEMNVEFWGKHQDTPFEKSKELLKMSHSNVMKLIETFSNEELFAKNQFIWTGGSTLGQYCVSATSSHYDWAIKKIKAYIKMHRSRKG